MSKKIIAGVVGDVTAYAYAKAGGYTGTEEEFQALMAANVEAAKYADEVRAAAAAANEDKEAAAESKDAAAASQADAATSKAAAETAANYARTYTGAPRVAATAAAMTDQSLIYVYTGSETGYTAGNWYFWDGTTWTSGGVYNSTALETDETLTVSGAAADAKVTGDEIGALKIAINYAFEIIDNRYIGKTTGNEYSDTTDYCVTNFIPVKDHVTVFTVDSNDSVAGYAFYGVDKYPISGSYSGIYSISNTLTVLNVPDGAAFFRISCLKSQKSKLKVIYDIANVVSKLANEDISNTFGSIQYKGGYILNYNGTIGNFYADANYISSIIPVYTGEKYYIIGSGTTNARLWSLHTSAKETTRIADANTTKWPNSPAILEIASNERYLVFNSTATAKGGIVKCGDNSNTTFNTRMFADERINSLESSVAEAESDITTLENYTDRSKYSYRNNLKNDGVETLPIGTQIYLNGTASDANYGVDKAKYVLPLKSTNKLHFYFEYQFTEPVGILGPTAADCIRLFRYAGATSGAIWKDAMVCNTLLKNNTYVGIYNAGTSYARDNFANDAMYERFEGEAAFYVRYTGSGSSAKLTWSASSAVLVVDGETIATVAIDPDDSVSTLVNALDAITDLECVAIAVSGKTCGQLLYRTTAYDINLIKTYTYGNGTQYTDSPAIMIPYALDEKWHTIEAIISIEENEATGYFAFDGYTRVSGIPRSAISGGTLIIGGDSDTVAPIRMRNLQIDIGHTGDAELISSVAPPYTAKTQLISNHNPRLLIYEGHGVDVCEDADGYISDDMAVSTDRLMIVFETLKSKGYVPVTWPQIVDWKINNKPLPKRCFTLMMDDWRFANYVDVPKRTPFEKYNVKPGLAVISDEHALTDEITINNITYTAGQMIEITKNAGWYPSSHTKNHRIITNYKPSELIALFREDAISCNLHNIYSDVLTYPQGLFNSEDITAFMLSPFKVGVSIVQNWYNCRAANDAYLTRVELGFRATLENVLAPIV